MSKWSRRILSVLLTILLVFGAMGIIGANAAPTANGTVNRDPAGWKYSRDATSAIIWKNDKST